MSSPEVERFEITEDDYNDEFNPGRKRFRMSKHQATYGIWADEDSDDEGGRPSFGNKGRSQKDYSAPMNFVSGGVKVGDKVTKKKAAEDAADDDDASSDSDREANAAVMASVAGRKAKKQAFQGGGRQAGEGVGDWERHTKGIGQKLLEQMGHVPGKGLGRDLQGISNPVEAFKRRGKAALGFYGTERTKQSLRDYPQEEVGADEAEDEEFHQQMSQWKKFAGDKKKKPKYVYKTAEQLISSGGQKKGSKGAPSELSKVKVIDMTGKEQRVLSGYHAIAHKHDQPQDDDSLSYTRFQEKRAFEMPELMHNLDLLVDLAEDEIIQNAKKLSYEQDLVVNLEHEQQRLKEVCDTESHALQRLAEIMSLVDQLDAASAAATPTATDDRQDGEGTQTLTLDACAVALTDLRREYPDEYRLYDLSVLAITLVMPLMKKEFADWQPLESPSHGLSTMCEWKSIMHDECPAPSRDGQLDSFDQLLSDVWLPAVRKAALSWSPRDSDAMIELVDSWRPLLAGSILDNVLDQLVMPRLQAEVDDWNPLTDTTPIHAWLHPWLPLLSQRLEPLYAPIRHKLAEALTNWHPSDPSAKMILAPWTSVFRPGHMAAFVTKNIVPKLAMCLKEFIINPHQQHLDSWNWVMLWQDVLPTETMADMLVKSFFPRWTTTLRQWLASSPNYDEVTKWYMGWKSMLSDTLIACPNVQEQFRLALDAMNRAVSGHYQPGARESVAYLTHTERRGFHPSEEPGPLPGRTSTPAVPTSKMSFRELVERKAEEHHLLFAPIPNKSHEGRQVYLFGSVQIYIDRSVLFMCEDYRWTPVSLNTLVSKAR